MNLTRHSHTKKNLNYPVSYSKKNNHMNMANIVTGCRILLSVIMLFSKVLSPVFYICYLAAGFSDMIDGRIARKCGTVSNVGEKLDTVADMILIAVTAIKILPILDISKGIIIWIVIIALIKIANIVFGMVLYKQFVSIHSVANKVTGALLFVFPLTIAIVPLQYSTILICIVATFAAVQEGHLLHYR